jgi:hypothetical protein
MTRLRARVAVLLPSLALAVTAVASPATASTASPAGSPATQNLGQAAAGWLARQMVGGSHFTDTFDGTTYPDQGLTIDSIFAFAATGTADNYGARAIAWLARPHILASYIGNGTTSAYAGATAKLLLAAEVRGVDPATFGGVNLPARLASLLTPSGRYSDQSKFGDFSNAFSQSLAILATTRLGGAPASAVSFLVSTECADGGFPLDVQALLAAGQTAPAQRGLHWLARAQQPDGGLAESAGDAPDANSTGLAGEAFAAAGWHMRAVLARQFLVSLQVGCSGPPRERGAIAFDDTGFAKGTAARATGQGTLGLADVGLSRLTSAGERSGDPRLACSS